MVHGGLDAYPFADGMVVEHWGLHDDMGLMRQLGVFPEPPPPVEAEPRVSSPLARL